MSKVHEWQSNNFLKDNTFNTSLITFCEHYSMFVYPQYLLKSDFEYSLKPCAQWFLRPTRNCMLNTNNMTSKETAPLLSGTTILLVSACSGSKVIGNFSSLRTWRKMKWWKLYKRDNWTALKTTSRTTLSATVTSPERVNTGNSGTFTQINHQR